MLEPIPLPGTPEGERSRLSAVLERPTEARVATMMLHQERGHLPNRVMRELWKLAKALAGITTAAMAFRCKYCGVTSEPKHTSTTSPPKPMNYVYNLIVGVACWEIRDNTGLGWLL